MLIHTRAVEDWRALRLVLGSWSFFLLGLVIKPALVTKIWL